jgi:hypothetical protein
MEIDSLQLTEDPLQYFMLQDDSRSHHFIYMKYQMNPTDPDFNPYLLVRIPSLDRKNYYFTMPHKGGTHVVDDGECETTPLHVWVKETSAFASISKLRFFLLFFLCGDFLRWKINIRLSQFLVTSIKVAQIPMFMNPLFYKMLIEVKKLRKRRHTFSKRIF